MDKNFIKPTPEQVAWVFKHLKNHFDEGGSFRYLIYDRLGFDKSEYLLFFENGGFALSQIANEHLEYEKLIDKFLEIKKSNKNLTNEELKEILQEFLDDEL